MEMNKYQYAWLTQSLCRVIGSYKNKNFEVIYNSDRRLCRVNGKFTNKEKEEIKEIVLQ